MRIGLYQPDIPQNTGNILRTAACFGLAVDVIEPCGFLFTTKLFRRAGMDYLDHVTVDRHADWNSFKNYHRHGGNSARIVLLTTKSSVRFTDFAFESNDILLLGSESAGVPDSVHEACDARITIPMLPHLRSLNVASSLAMVLSEALRQTDGFPSPTSDQT